MNGRANIILDNGIADGRIEPMIVVMPQGHALQGQGVGPLVRLQGETGMFSPRFPKDLLEDVLPLIERKYRVRSGAANRAIAGLSMGGAQALSIGLANPDKFGYVLGYSAAVFDGAAGADEILERIRTAPGGLTGAFRLVWIGCGRQDFLLRNNREYVDALRKGGLKLTYHETEGGHVWSVWRHYLNDTLPLLFR